MALVILNISVLASEFFWSQKILLHDGNHFLFPCDLGLTVSACLMWLTAWKPQPDGLLYILFGNLDGHTESPFAALSLTLWFPKPKGHLALKSLILSAEKPVAPLLWTLEACEQMRTSIREQMQVVYIQLGCPSNFMEACSAIARTEVMANWNFESSSHFVDYLLGRSFWSLLPISVSGIPPLCRTRWLARALVTTVTTILWFSQNNFICFFEPGIHRCLVLSM